jgi:RNA polymerase sigma-70 factor (ECF subfamily)
MCSDLRSKPEAPRSGPGEATQLVQQLRDGDPQVSSELILLVYDELRRLAIYYMRNELPGHTLQPTALVHEAYLRLMNRQSTPLKDGTHFLAVAALTMRRLLVDHARGRLRDKRGGQLQRMPLTESSFFSGPELERFIALNEALESLAQLDPRQTRIVELRYLAGLTVEETAQVLGISPKTVKRDWSMAQAWLRRELGRCKNDHQL